MVKNPTWYVAAAALLFLLAGEDVTAQKKTGFNGRQIEMAEIKAGQSDAISSKAFAGKKLIMVEGASESFGKGIPLGENRYLISVPAETNSSQLLAAGIKSWAPLVSASKINMELSRKFTQSFASTAKIYVLCSPGTDEKQLRAAWQPAWGSLLEAWQNEGILRLTINATKAQIQAISTEGWSMQIEETESEIIPHNQVAADNGRVNTLAGSGFGWTSGLSGKGVTVGIGDGGLVDYHADLQSHQFNLVTTKLTSFSDHPDHVTGTIGGLGLINPSRKGMAPEARLLNHQTSNIITNAVTLRNKQNLTLTNNSYGTTLNCTKSGLYNSTSSMMDGQTASNPDLLHVVSAGNAGTSTCSPYPAGFYNISEGYPAAKNCLTVGLITGTDAPNTNSCKGPLRDGRVKPEIMANGDAIFSTIPGDSYNWKSGTSQAAPVITGTLALLTERYMQLNSGQNPEAALLKALVCNTADDLGQPNVDFTNGYGRLNARKARLVLENSNFRSNSIASNGNQSFSITVPAGVSSMKVMLSWTDPAAVSSPVKALINDLNLTVQRSDGSVNLPWVLNPSAATVSQAAVRGTDTLNNMEQVTLNVNPGEQITIRTTCKTISGSSQKYWIVYDWVKPELVLTAPVNNQMLKTATAAVFRLDASGYTFNSMILETSTDSINWTTAQTFATSTALFSNYTPSGTSFRKAWFRLRGVASGQNILSNAIKVVISPQPAPTAAVCDRTARLSWTAVTGATKYEFFRLNRTKGSWDAIGFTTSLQYYVSGLSNGVREFFAVKPWFGNEPGLMSLGIAATPTATACAWTKDLGIARLVSPLSGRLSTSSAPSSTIQLELQNFSNTALTAQACTLNYRRSDGSTQSFPLSLSIGAGLKQSYTLPVAFSQNEAGVHNLRFWLNTAGDLNTSNDTLKTTIKVIANPQERSFPLTLNFESLPDFSLNSNSTGISGEDRLDFTSVNEARILSRMKNAPQGFGTKSLVLDKERVDTRTGSSEAIFTLNLSNFSNPRELKLSFDFLSFGSLSSGNSLSFRPSDQVSWITILDFSQESFLAGVPKSYSSIDLLALLGGASPSSSFQIRFSFSGQRSSEIETLGGYAADNIVITIPSSDLAASSLQLPPENCYAESEQREVKVQVQNNGGSSIQNAIVSYQVKGFSIVSDTIASLNAGEVRTHTFSKKLTANQFGKLDVQSWIKIPGDGNPGNDSTSAQVNHFRIINQYPYYESFEESAASWAASGTTGNGLWTWGSGSGKQSATDSAANGIRFWYSTALSGNNSAEVSYLNSPCFDLSREGQMQISFNQAFNLSGNQGHWLEISQNGNDWTRLGNNGEGMNWYNETSNQWANTSQQWQPGSLKFPQDFNPAAGLVRFRFALGWDISSGGTGAALDDVHIEAVSEVEQSQDIDQSEASTDPAAWLSFGKNGNRAAMLKQAQEMGLVNFQMKLHQDGIRSYNDQYYLDRNFLFLTQTIPVQQQKIRLFITDAELKKLMEKDAGLPGIQKLGVFRYNGPNRDFTLENNEFNNETDFAFIQPASVRKVPTFGGSYLEFDAFAQSEFYVCRKTLVNFSPAQALRTASMDLPHEPVEIKWLTPLDESAGKQLDRKIAWYEPAAGALFLEGINGNTARIRLLDLKGQIVLDEVFTGYKFQAKTSGLAKGIYTLRVEQDSSSETFRLVLD